MYLAITEEGGDWQKQRAYQEDGGIWAPASSEESALAQPKLDKVLEGIDSPRVIFAGFDFTGLFYLVNYWDEKSLIQLRGEFSNE